MTNTGDAIPSPRRNKAGQAMIFFVMVLVALVFIVLWNYDLHKILFVKSVAQNGGDSAALMAARWQGVTLNLIGDLNVMHALSIHADGSDADIAPAINAVQARLCYAGPMLAFMASQQAAKNNGVFQNDGFSRLTTNHAEEVRNDYPNAADPGGDPLFPEPYPGCWEEYADMLEHIGTDGVAAGADNAHFYSDAAWGHMLLRADFYSAIAGKDWCWWHDNAPTLLDEYENFFPCWWDPLPESPHVQYINSEIFGLGLTRVETALSDMDASPALPAGLLEDLASDREIEGDSAQADIMDAAVTWYTYAPPVWSPWDTMNTSGGDPFPLTGTLNPIYDYAGADAAVRIEATAERITPGQGGSTVSNTILWTAAAKPFGYLEEDTPPHSYGLVLPAFREVALIPVDASSAPSGGSYNMAWREHIELHLPDYMEEGPSEGSECRYCRQLTKWEVESFRQEGVGWLSSNSWRCTASGGSGGHRGGGTPRGH